MKDKICPACKNEMIVVSELVLTKDKKFKHYYRCDNCNKPESLCYQAVCSHTPSHNDEGLRSQMHV